MPNVMKGGQGPWPVQCMKEILLTILTKLSTQMTVHLFIVNNIDVKVHSNCS